ncbi:hypothetical protein ACH4YO_42945, partial [Streptomyces noursei]|uniref:hypothetical protein n=1 Tax=Streptomyces noursei TaxID=1971 RepID=UPI0033C4D1C5
MFKIAPWARSPAERAREAWTWRLTSAFSKLLGRVVGHRLEQDRTVLRADLLVRARPARPS